MPATVSTSQKETLSSASRPVRSHLPKVAGLMFHSRQNAACVNPDDSNSATSPRRSSALYETRPCLLISFVSMPDTLSGFAGAAYGVEEKTFTILKRVR